MTMWTALGRAVAATGLFLCAAAAGAALPATGGDIALAAGVGVVAQRHEHLAPPVTVNDHAHALAEAPGVEAGSDGLAVPPGEDFQQPVFQLHRVIPGLPDMPGLA